MSRELKEGEELDYDPEAYRMFHTFETGKHIARFIPVSENACLSFDVVHDNLGEKREQSPFTCYLVGGTQVEKLNQNQLIVMRLSNMHTMADEKEDSDAELEDDEDEAQAEQTRKAKDPVLTAALIKHQGEVNRVKVSVAEPPRP